VIASISLYSTLVLRRFPYRLKNQWIASVSFVSLAMTRENTIFSAVPGLLSNSVIASEAKQSQTIQWDCFVSSFLAMTVENATVITG